MRAIDTNILVRAIVRDHPDQARIAEDVIRGGILVLPTVLMEAEWVLRSRYALSRQQIADALETILQQLGVVVVSEDAVAVALSTYAKCGDFADLMHVALAEEQGASEFISFDRSIANVDGAEIALTIV